MKESVKKKLNNLHGQAYNLLFLRESQKVRVNTRNKKNGEKILTQKELSDRLKELGAKGSVTSIKNWESGKARLSDSTAINGYKKIYGCTSDFLLGHVSDPNLTLEDTEALAKEGLEKSHALEIDSEREFVFGSVASLLKVTGIGKIRKSSSDYVLYSIENVSDEKNKKLRKVNIKQEDLPRLYDYLIQQINLTINAFTELNKTEME